MRLALACLAVTVLHACGSSGSTLPPQPDRLPDGAYDLPDGAGDSSDVFLEEREEPDQAEIGHDIPSLDAGFDPAPDPGVDLTDGGQDALDATTEPADPGAPDLAADAGPVPPFATCDPTHPCQDPVQDVCLVMAGADHGTCVQACGPGKAACPSWQECLVVDEGLSACFVVAPYDEPCDPERGVLCDADRMEYCIPPPGGGGRRCTRYCGQDGPFCPAWQECVPVSDKASACFRKAEAPLCTDGICPEGLACHQGRCLEACAGTADCAPTESCVPAGGPGACVPVPAPEGADCSEAHGLYCREGLYCVAGQGGTVGHCARACATDSDCPAFTACTGGRCIRHDRLVPGAVPCGEAYPCQTPGTTCVPVGPDLSVCLPPCDPGPCPDGMTCVGGGCARVSGLMEICGPDRGVLCKEGLVCLVNEEADHHFGHCTRACGEDCDGFECVGGWCGVLAGYGEWCSVVSGTSCGPEPGLTCKVVRAGLRSGFCTSACQVGQSCPDPGGDLGAQCLLVSSPGWLCALTCGDLGGECPSFLDCTPYGICL